EWKQKKLEDWAPLDLQVLDYDGTTPAPQDVGKFAYCERQGRCFLGCLPGARHTLNKTLVKEGKRNLLNDPNPPVELRSLADVDRIEPLPGGGYRVFYENLRVGDGDSQRHKSATAPVVILAAGVLGSTQILLKSRKPHKFEFSDQLGRRFSTNGDFAGFIQYPTPSPLSYGIYATRGPINTSHVMFRDGKLFINLEDAGIPPMLAPAVRRAIEVFSTAAERDPLFREMKALWKMTFPENLLGLKPDARQPLRSDTEAEALQNTFFFNVMGRDEARGRFRLDGDDLTLRFEGGPLANDPVFKKIDELMVAMAQAMQGGTYVRFPFWGRNGIFLDNGQNPERKFVTVHPLGGCPMGNTSTDGAVDKQGRVFNTAKGGDSVHAGLYVADAAVIPGPLAVNPTLTIVAFAQKIAAQIPAAMAAAGTP
ncbi:MAG: hypothetical protein HY238_25890, partial [Acidobacteria bacterium]|nr:hypothetical protein [Acidobacteriota bacterium]